MTASPGWLGALQASWPDGAQVANLSAGAAQALVLLVALIFPLVRFLLDRTVFEARGAGAAWSTSQP